MPTCDIFEESIKLNLSVKTLTNNNKQPYHEVYCESVSKTKRIHCRVRKYHDTLAIN